ncbi:MAG: hypothetical protein IT460_06625 [Planctomycetes bacterium]|nr:hypothetical protein [Planctomycetota bacterium]
MGRVPFLAVLGLSVSSLVAFAAPARADDGFDAADAAARIAAAPAEVALAPRATLCGGAVEASFEDPCCSPCPRWSVSLGAWIWGVSGTVGNSGRELDVDSDWTDTLDILDKVEFALDARVRYETGPWSFMLGVDGSTIADSADFLDGRVSVDAEMSVWVVQGQVGYHLTGGKLGCSACPPVACLEAYVGARAWWVDVDVDTVGTAAPISLGGSDNWVDPIVGLRGEIKSPTGWFGLLEADIGGFGLGSDFTWHVLAAVGYSFNDHVALSIGWKHLDVDYSNDGFVFDVALSGPFLAVTFSF